jgi:alkylation response protein AidB-like acyl-CoA dehydrogenase
MGYKGVETTEMVMDGAACRPLDPRRRGRPRQGFYQMMDGVEVGRVNVAARACGISIRAFELAIAYAQQRSPSASRSPSTRRSRSSWPRWPPRSRPPTR